MTDTLERSQKEICERYGVSYYPSPPDMKMGISLNVREGITPINGLRHPPEGDTTGWYIWAGEALPGDPEFFKPVQVKHFQIGVQWCKSTLVCRPDGSFWLQAIMKMFGMMSHY